MRERKESHISSICMKQMKLNKKTWMIIPAVLLVGLCGCSSASSGSSSYVEMASYDEAKASADITAETNGAGINYGYQAEEADMEAEISPEQTSEKLVYRGSLSIQTRAYEESAAKLREMVKTYNGIIENENEYTNGGYYDNGSEKNLRSLNMTLRIPTEKFEEFVSGGGEIGNVISRSSSAENISRVYNDVSVQIEALEKQQKRLLEMMDQANTIEDMIAVEDRLSQVQYELNSLKTHRQSMDTDVAYSTINVSLNEVRIYSETDEGFFTKLSNRFVNGFRGFADNMADLILAAVYALPYLLIGALVIFGIGKSGMIAKIRSRGKKTEE